MRPDNFKPKHFEKVKEILAHAELSFQQIAALESVLAIRQGKGWGASSVEHEVRQCLSLLGHSPKTIIDVGANKGSYTDKVLSSAPDAQYYLFEPSEKNLLFLRQKYQSLDNILIFDCALSDKDCSAYLFTNEEGSGLASLTRRDLRHHGIAMNISESIQARRLDGIWNALDSQPEIIDYVKIDVEGHELAVLQGMGTLIGRTKIVQFEFGGTHIDTKTFFRDFWDFFHEKDFQIHRITPHGLQRIESYRECDECFMVSNYVAHNTSL